MSDLNVLCVIPARGGSVGLPNKNIMDLNGYPMIAYTIKAAKESKLTNKIVVSTDSDKIMEIASIDFKCDSIKRPEVLSTGTARLSDVARHAVLYLKDNFNYDSKIVVIMQPNVPIRPKGIVDKVVTELLESNATACVTVKKVNQYPEWMKVIEDGWLYPYMQPKSIGCRQDIPDRYMLDGSVMAVCTDTLMSTQGDTKTHAHFGTRVKAMVQEDIFSMDIDNKEDFMVVSSLMEKLNCFGREYINVKD